jgi:ParB/RepB/Spo0J family partition protein
VRRNGNGYELIAGERRLRALRLLGRLSVPAIVQPDVNARQALQLALVENVQRVALNPVEEAQAITAMLNVLEMTPAEIAASLGKKIGYVERALAIMRLPDEVLAELDTGKLSPAVAGALAKWSEHPKLAQMMAYHAIMGKVSAATIEESPLPFADKLYADKLIVEVSHKAYRDEACLLCPFAALVMERRDGHQDRYWCLRPTHAAELDVEFEHKKARDQESARMDARQAHLETDPDQKKAKAPDLGRLPYSTYETIGYRTMPAGCTGECPCRGVCQGSGDQLVEICLDTGRLRALKAGTTRKKNQTERSSKNGLLTDALIELDRMTAGDRTPLAIIAQVVLERLGYDGRGVLDKALERYLPGVKISPANKWKTGPDDYERLAAIDPALLVQTLVGALVFAEVGQKDSNMTVTRYLAGARGTAAGGSSTREDATASDGDEEEESDQVAGVPIRDEQLPRDVCAYCKTLVTANDDRVEYGLMSENTDGTAHLGCVPEGQLQGVPQPAMITRVTPAGDRHERIEPGPIDVDTSWADGIDDA